LREGDALHGVDQYLLENRGLVDIMFHPVNGNAATEEEGAQLTRKLRDLHERNFVAADAIYREITDRPWSSEIPTPERLSPKAPR